MTALLASLADRRAALADALEALDGLHHVVYQSPGTELGDLLRELDALSARVSGARVAVTLDAVTRGEVAASAHPRTALWIKAHAPSLAAEGAGPVSRCVDALARPDADPTIRQAALTGRIARPSPSRR